MRWEISKILKFLSHTQGLILSSLRSEMSLAEIYELLSLLTSNKQ
jgi:hypothetical protein